MTHLEERIEKSFEHCVKIMENSGEELAPMLDIEYIDENDKTGNVVCVVMSNDPERQQKFIGSLGVVFAGVKRMGRIKEVKSVLFMSEGWFTTLTNEEVEKAGGIKNIPKPSQMKNKREMLLVSGRTEDKTYGIKNKEIIRTEVKGKKYFSLADFNKDGGTASIEKAPILDEFFDGYEFTINNHDPKGDELQKKAIEHAMFKDISTEHIIKLGIERVFKTVGGEVEY